MRKKLETLPLSELKAIAKENQLKNVSTLRKAELIDVLCALHESRQGDAAPQNEEKSEPVASPASVMSTGPVAEVSRSADKTSPVEGENSAEAAGRPAEEIQSAESYQPVTASQPAGVAQATAPAQTMAPSQPAEGEQRRPREYRPRNTEFAQRAAGMQRRPQQQMRQNGGRPQRTYDNAQRMERSALSSDGGQRPERSNQFSDNAQRPERSGQAADSVQRPERNVQTEGQETPVETVQTTPVVSETSRVENTYASAESQPAQVKETAEGAVDNAEYRDELQALDSGIIAQGILEVMPDGFGFIRSANYMPGDEDVYVAPSQIRRFNLKTGDIVTGTRRIKTSGEKFAALLYVNQVNGYAPAVIQKRPNFEDLTPIFPNKRLHLERPGGTKAMRIVDLLSPIGKGQRGMIVSPPKAGKTTLLKDVAKAITANHPDMHLIILLIDERPEEVTDIKESIEGENVEVIYSTFDELPEHHKRVSEMVLERAKRLVEHGRDVMILLDSITRLARAYNLTVAPSGRTLSGGLDPAALYMPKRFFGAARNMREGGSLTVLATALVDTGSRMDDVVFEEFKGTGNMELVLNRKLSEKRIFPAIDIQKSGTRRDDLLLTPEERATADLIHKVTGESRGDDAVERVLNLFSQTRTNREFIAMSGKLKFGN